MPNKSLRKRSMDELQSAGRWGKEDKVDFSRESSHEVHSWSLKSPTPVHDVTKRHHVHSNHSALHVSCNRIVATRRHGVAHVTTQLHRISSPRPVMQTSLNRRYVIGSFMRAAARPQCPAKEAVFRSPWKPGLRVEGTETACGSHRATGTPRGVTASADPGHRRHVLQRPEE